MIFKASCAACWPSSSAASNSSTSRPPIRYRRAVRRAGGPGRRADRVAATLHYVTLLRRAARHRAPNRCTPAASLRRHTGPSRLHRRAQPRTAAAALCDGGPGQWRRSATAGCRPGSDEMVRVKSPPATRARHAAGVGIESADLAWRPGLVRYLTGHPRPALVQQRDHSSATTDLSPAEQVGVHHPTARGPDAGPGREDVRQHRRQPARYPGLISSPSWAPIDLQVRMPPDQRATGRSPSSITTTSPMSGSTPRLAGARLDVHRLPDPVERDPCRAASSERF